MGEVRMMNALRAVHEAGDADTNDGCTAASQAWCDSAHECCMQRPGGFFSCGAAEECMCMTRGYSCSGDGSRRWGVQE